MNAWDARLRRGRTLYPAHSAAALRAGATTRDSSPHRASSRSPVSSAWASGEEDELTSWSIGRTSNLVYDVAVRDEILLDFLAFTESQCRVGRQRCVIRRKHGGRSEADEWTLHVGQFVPALDGADTVDLAAVSLERVIDRSESWMLETVVRRQHRSASRMNSPIAARYASVSSRTGVCELCSRTTSRAPSIPVRSVEAILSVHMSYRPRITSVGTSISCKRSRT